MKLKEYIILFSSILFLASTEIKASDECFEGTSRAIFKFNMSFDNAILEPIAKGYNKLPEPIKLVRSGSVCTQNMSVFRQL